MGFHATSNEFHVSAPWRAARDRRRQSRRESARVGQALTARESELCDLVSRAWANKEIACALGLSEQTVKNCLSGAFKKLGVTTRMELMRYWLRNGQAHGAAGAERRAA